MQLMNNTLNNIRAEITECKKYYEATNAIDERERNIIIGRVQVLLYLNKVNIIY